jgi:hypothetical protein
VADLAQGVGGVPAAPAPKDLIEAADAAPYAAKRRGCNAVVEHGFGEGLEYGGGRDEDGGVELRTFLSTPPITSPPDGP